MGLGRRAAYLKLIGLRPARLTLPLDPLSQFDRDHPSNSSSPTSQLFAILLLNTTFLQTFNYSPLDPLSQFDRDQPSNSSSPTSQLLFTGLLFGKTYSYPVLQ